MKDQTQIKISKKQPSIQYMNTTSFIENELKNESLYNDNMSDSMHFLYADAASQIWFWIPGFLLDRYIFKYHLNDVVQ